MSKNKSSGNPGPEKKTRISLNSLEDFKGKEKSSSSNVRINSALLKSVLVDNYGFGVSSSKAYEIMTGRPAETNTDLKKARTQLRAIHDLCIEKGISVLRFGVELPENLSNINKSGKESRYGVCVTSEDYAEIRNKAGKYIEAECNFITGNSAGRYERFRPKVEDAISEDEFDNFISERTK